MLKNNKLHCPLTEEQIEIITKTLKEFNCKKWYLFGSQVDGTANEYSDYDIGVIGIPITKIIRASSTLWRMTNLDIDLVNFGKEKNFIELF